jgi:hypothetical protein
MQGRLAAYVDSEGTMTAIAPAGWTCTASIGADGSGDLSIFPQGQAANAEISSDPKLEAVTVEQSGGCVTCAATQACSLFATANAEIMSSLNRTCVEPIGEETHDYSAHVVFFDDPPGIEGNGNPSGGTYPSNGLVTYFPAGNAGTPLLSSWKESCTMAQGAHRTCTAILNLFLKEHEAD